MTNIESAPRKQPPIVVFRQRLEERMGEIKSALPSDITPAQFVRAALTSVSINPEILGCSWQSTWLALLRACRDGLLPDGIEGALVPYKSTANWVPMYQGLLRRFRRSGQLRWVTAGVARQGEKFSHYIDEAGEHFHHTPGDDFTAPITKVYAIATTKDGAVFVTTMPLAEVNKIRSMSKATRDDSPWRQWPEEMMKKSALRRLLKLLPTARDLIPPSEEIEPGQHDDQSLAPAPDIIDSSPAPSRAAGPAAALDEFAESKEKPAAAGPPQAGNGGPADRAIPGASVSETTA
jgi:recombination protein RecT